jgi:hypothetical protein
VIIKKTPAEIEQMAAAGAILVATLELLESKVRAGVSTEELDQAAERFIRSQGAVPSFKGYHGFPGSICASPNSMVVHGIPGPYRLSRGDILSIDVGVTRDRAVAVRRRRAMPRGQPPRRRLARDPAGGRGRRAVGRAFTRRPRGRARHARGSPSAELRRTGQGAVARGGDGAGHRTDDHRRPRRSTRHERYVTAERRIRARGWGPTRISCYHPESRSVE